MSKITNDGLTRSGTGCFIAISICQQWVSKVEHHEELLGDVFVCDVVLQQLIMQKAAEELKKQQEREMEEKKKAIEERVPKLDIDGLDKRTQIIIIIIIIKLAIRELIWLEMSLH